MGKEVKPGGSGPGYGEKPNRLATAGKWSLGVGGASVIFAAQTRPEDATSSIAAWLHYIGVDKVPPFLSALEADFWATFGGFVALIIVLGIWVLHKVQIWPRRSSEVEKGYARTKAVVSRYEELRRESVQQEAAPPQAFSEAPLAPASISVAPEPSRDSEFERVRDDVLGNVEQLAERMRGPFDMSSLDYVKRAVGGGRAAPRLRRDTTVSEALAYAALGRWGEKFSKVPLHYADWQSVNPPVEQFQKAALDRGLTVWGKRACGTVFEEIPWTYWREHGLDVQSLMMGRAATVPLVKMEDTALFEDLMVNRGEVERTWPHAG